jgi:hypothetical protein
MAKETACNGRKTRIWFQAMDTSALIDRLGGTGKTADICGVSPAAVTLWRRGGIPPLHWAAIVEHAKLNSVDGVTYDAIQSARNAAKVA